jgi:hypothetical protein
MDWCIWNRGCLIRDDAICFLRYTAAGSLHIAIRVADDSLSFTPLQLFHGVPVWEGASEGLLHHFPRFSPASSLTCIEAERLG